ncbi:MAG: GH92 family glycosyl hydrolase [Odoribacter sp.]|nr:GH92 family glycosyl hydrolase [Odoribacter sp.]
MYKNFLIFLLIINLFTGCRSSSDKDNRVTDYVDPFIGTGGHGHCFPGAIVPFGAIQLSPDNPRSGWDWCSGYHYSDSVICSFSHTHLSGTGIGDLQDIRFLPTNLQPVDGQNATEFIRSCWTTFSHEREVAQPGYYSVVMDNGIVTELSVTERCGIHYYHFPDNGVNALNIDLTTAFNWDRTTEASIKKINNRKIQGYRKSRGWARDQRVYFVAEFSQDVEILAGKDTLVPLENGQHFTADTCYAWVDFGNKTNQILVKVSISSANSEGAEENLKTELNHWSFDKVKRGARALWKRQLGKIRVESDNEELLKTFYTALYHAYTAPYIYSDGNGNFKGPDGEIHSVANNTQYTVFSLWDTYRALHPLFTFTQRNKVSDMVNSMLKHYDDYGLLPVWELVGNETNCMIGNHSIPVIAEAYLKGIKGIDGERAYEAMKKTVMSGRDGLKELREYGYIPYELVNESVSKTLEYAYDDWCVAQMAKALGKDEDYHYFMEQSKNYANVYDAETGFMRGKNAEGKWKTPFSPFFSSHQDDEYTEGNAWQYSWFVPHDVNGLIELHGGKEPFVRKLDSLFTIPSDMEGENVSPDISGMIGQYAQGNEPSHHIAYLFNYAGQPWKTQYYVDKIRRELYTTGPDGLCGNEDCGQMSAWYVFSALGFYPVNPVEMKYQLGTPLFKKVSIRIGAEKKFVIIANKDSDEHIYVTKVILNGAELGRNYITHDELMLGGVLEFKLSTQRPE